MTTEEKITALESKIEQKKARIDYGVITNDRTLRFAKAAIRIWTDEIKELKQNKGEKV